MKRRRTGIVIQGKDEIDSEKMHKYAKKVLEAEGIPFFEFDFDDYFMDLHEKALYEVAKEIVILEQKASASFLQYDLGIGYERAMRLLEMLEKEGIISKNRGTLPRIVYYEEDEEGEFRRK
ncbi:MAG: DNA translocase FtsK [Candidatus Moranbacteria bacterium]|nr:DNA translocase FtsK [Candidatus Moranbacteria bacterium]